MSFPCVYGIDKYCRSQANKSISISIYYVFDQKIFASENTCSVATIRPLISIGPALPEIHSFLIYSNNI